MLDELLTDFEENGICECINENYRKLPQFVVSAVNVRGACPIFPIFTARTRTLASPHGSARSVSPS